MSERLSPEPPVPDPEAQQIAQVIKVVFPEINPDELTEEQMAQQEEAGLKVAMKIIKTVLEES